MDLRKYMNPFFLSCKKATLLIEKKELLSLTPVERIQLNLHTSMCVACRTYEKQSITIGHAISKLFGNAPLKEKTLSPEAKNRLITKITETTSNSTNTK